MMARKIGILGAGTWGTALARMLAVNGSDVLLWSAIPQEIDSLAQTHVHPNLPGMVLPESLRFERATQRVGVVLDLLVRGIGPHKGRAQKGYEPKDDRAVLVLQRDLLDLACVAWRNVEPLALHDLAAVGYALGGVVVAGYDENRHIVRHERGQEPVGKGDGFRARRGLVVDVSGDEDGIDTLRFERVEHVLEYVPLIVEQ